MKKVAVVGGGITGLTAAFHLQQAGLHPLLFEKAPSPGGAIRSTADGGYLVEEGPATLQLNSTELSSLIADLDLKESVIEANALARKRFIVRGGRPLPAPASPRAFFLSPLLSWKGKLRLIKEPYVAAGADHESLASFCRRRLGKEVLDTFINPLAGGIYAGDPERLSARHAFPRLFEMERKHGSLFRGMVAAIRSGRGGGGKPRLISFQNGLSTIAARLAERLKKNIYFETTVESIAARGKGWEIIATRYGRRLRDRYDAVILALPPDALADLKVENREQDRSLRLLQEIPHPPVATVSLGFQREQVDHPLDGFGMLIPQKEGASILGTLFASTLFPGRAPEGHVLLTSFVGGMRQPDLARRDPEQLERLVLKDLSRLLRVSGRPTFARSRLWPRAIPQYEIGHERFLESIDRFERENAGLFVAGTSRDGISLGNCVTSGYRHAKRAERWMTEGPAKPFTT